jgi:hypothetical protein
MALVGFSIEVVFYDVKNYTTELLKCTIVCFLRVGSSWWKGKNEARALNESEERSLGALDFAPSPLYAQLIMYVVMIDG